AQLFSTVWKFYAFGSAARLFESPGSARRWAGTVKGSDGSTTLGRVSMVNWPKYVCAILEDAEGRLLLERRPDNAQLAAGRLTCFGGRREAAETPEECLRRELREELSWEPQALEKRVELWVADDLVAWFYEAVFDVSVEQLRLAAGYEA